MTAEEKKAYDRSWRERNKERKRETDRRWALANRERRRENAKKYYARNRERINAYLLAYTRKLKATDPDRFYARVRLNTAVRLGKVTRKPCSVCGEKRVQAHHHKGYAKEFWYDVVWLCKLHHEEAHHAKV